MKFENSLDLSNLRLMGTQSGLVDSSGLSDVHWHIERGEDTFTLPAPGPVSKPGKLIPTKQQDGGNFNYGDIFALADLQSQVRKIEEFLAELEELSNTEGFPVESVVRQTHKIWEFFQDEIVDKLRYVPLIALGEDNGVMFSIREEEKIYMEIEILESGIELYYLEMATGKDDFFEFERVDNKLIKKIRSLLV